ncbi:hypothetical protein [Spirosoma sp.]
MNTRWYRNDSGNERITVQNAEMWVLIANRLKDLGSCYVARVAAR